jgi:hypothetical protein
VPALSSRKQSRANGQIFGLGGLGLDLGVVDSGSEIMLKLLTQPYQLPCRYKRKRPLITVSSRYVCVCQRTVHDKALANSEDVGAMDFVMRS